MPRIPGNPSRPHFSRLLVWLCVLAQCSALVLAQTPVKLPKNKYTPEQDVKLGLQAADEVRQQYPLIEDDQVVSYFQRLGERLVAVAPPELNQPVFQYSFTPVNLKEINAFALPGGPMFVNRGMVEAAASEGEVAGVMAHELAHVLLRHGTANATKAQNPWLQLGAIGGAVAGAVVGGAAGSAIAQSSQFGLGTLLLKYSRDFEKQADLLGAQIMARAGYDPRDLARMFETIQRQSKGGSPQWLSSHPDPGNRTAYITQEASMLTVAGPPPDSSGFAQTRAKFAAMAPALTAAEAARRAAAGPAPAALGTVGEPVPPPSAQYRSLRGGGVFEAAVPADWTSVSTNSAIKVVPVNGYGPYNGQPVFTHGVEFGVARAASRDLREATRGLLRSLAQGNPELRLAGDQVIVRMSGRSAIGTPLINRSALGGNERIDLYTTFLVDGTLFYYLAISPEAEAESYRTTFQRIGQSIRLTDAR